MKEFLYSPLTLTIGRQELHFGNDMIIGDPDTNNAVTTASPFNGSGTGLRDPDLSARKAFDAIRATLNYDVMSNPLVVDVVIAQVKNTTFGNRDDENLYGVNVNYELNKKTTLEGYWWERSRGKVNTAAGTASNKSDRTDVYGARIVNQSIKNLTAQVEAAMQLGNVNTSSTITQRRRAWATEAFLTYDLKDVKKVGKYKPTATALFAFFSGNKDNSGNKTNKAWDPMYENQKCGDLANALLNQSNIMLTGGILTAKPVDDVTLKGEYYAYWWDKVFQQGGTAQTILTGETLTMTDGKFVGQEIDLTATYDYTEDVQFALMGGMFMPGDSFDSINRNTATEVIGSMKVTF
ncbi:MAG: alginate export family protein [Candidatus Omnitrophica bacterium]|nr:alginate export family protein [Candidatus Omnitrophota bacterium]